jgi:hypothetical protein
VLVATLAVIPVLIIEGGVVPSPRSGSLRAAFAGLTSIRSRALW